MTLQVKGPLCSLFPAQEYLVGQKGPGSRVQEAQVCHGAGLVFTGLAGISFSLGEEPLFSPTLEGTPCGTPAKLFHDLESESVSHAVSQSVSQSVQSLSCVRLFATP